MEEGRIHGYPSRVREVGQVEESHYSLGYLGKSGELKKLTNAQKVTGRPALHDWEEE